jgi:hypothetical protein
MFLERDASNHRAAIIVNKNNIFACVKTTVDFLYGNIDVATHVLVYIGLYVLHREQMLLCSTYSPCADWRHIDDVGGAGCSYN